jgi:hypothetical protein
MFLLYIYDSYPMPCSYDDHDRLEFLESDKEALLLHA